MREYDLISDWYSSNRDARTGVADVDRVLSRIQPGAEVLDAGCGDGRPIAQMIDRRGFRLTGIDSSERMLEKFRRNLPSCRALLGNIADTELPERRFALIVCWGCLFHLETDEQLRALKSFSRALVEGGHLLFTSGKDQGEVTGVMDGVQFNYASLGVALYEDALCALGLTKVRDYADGCENYVYHYAAREI
jgi:SAM-dependent methyltransferase